MSGFGAVCWKCGEMQEEILLPLSRTEECQSCGTDLHVCRMCRFYDTSVNNACREPVADFVSDKTRANFCGYLELRSDAAPDAGTAAEASAADDLNSLFGLDEGQHGKDSGDSSAALDDLFGLGGKSDE